jgi:alkylation response protein AidB-like acyl-CoA dehydrogenase
MPIMSPLEAVQSLSPLSAQDAAYIEDKRCLPEHVVRTLVEGSVFRMLTPKALGGLEMEPLDACAVVEEAARLDGSLGWCVMISGCYGLFGGMLQDAAAHEIFGNPATVSAGAFRPNGVARAVEGGYLVSGRWSLGSNITHSNWVVAGVRIFEGETMRMTERGPAVRLVFIPRDQVTIHDTWHVGGLKGTGSHDYEITDVFVPHERSCSFSEPPVQQGPLYHMPAIPLFGALIASVSLGIARHAIDAAVDLAGTKTPLRASQPLKAQSPAQVQFGEAEGLLRSGRSLMRETLRDAYANVQKIGRTNWDDRCALWLANTQAATQACEAVDLVFKAGGASSPYASAGLERCLRDIRVASQHICVASTNFELAGQQTLGSAPVKSVWATDDRGDY